MSKNETTKREAAALLAALQEITGAAVAECKDADLLDLVYKLLITDSAPAPKPAPKPQPKPEPQTYDATEYREKIAALMDEAPGYILATVYGFIKTLMEG